MTRIRRASLLIVLAHPDDEIFHGGILAHLSQRGALRTEELRLSCARLGIEPPVLLRFHDSARKERQRHDDPHALANVDMLDVEAAIRGIIADVKPQVIVTFEPHGGYYHPDHIAIHRATTAAFFSSGGMGVDAPERLFYAAMRSDVFRVFAEASRGRGFLDGLDSDVFAAAPDMIAVSFDARAYLEQKLSALAAHRSAFGVTPEMIESPPPGVAQMLQAFRPVLEHEVFILGGVRGAVPRWPLEGFFDGLETAALHAADMHSVPRDVPA